MADLSDLILTYILIPGYHQQQQQKQKQQQEQINAATSRFHPYSLNTNQTSIPSSPFSDFATVSSDQKSKGSSGHGTSLASSSLGGRNWVHKLKRPHVTAVSLQFSKMAFLRILQFVALNDLGGRTWGHPVRQNWGHWATFELSGSTGSTKSCFRPNPK